MSVDSRIIVGLTLELDTCLTTNNFKKLHELEDKYPEIDEFNHDRKDREGKLLLIYDGMNSQFARLVLVDKYIDGGNLGNHNGFYELSTPKNLFNPEVVSKMFNLYEEYKGKRPNAEDFKYALWSQWY